MLACTAHKHSARRAIDSAVSEALCTVSSRFIPTRRAFEGLLDHVRRRSMILTPTRSGRKLEVMGYKEAVAALLALATHAPDWLRPVESWVPSGANRRPQISSLAQHLLAQYPIPAFMTSVWFLGDTQEGKTRQDWYKYLGLGGNIRTVELPLDYTKMMAHHFIQAPAHYTVEEALRWGQVRGLGGSEALARAVVATRLGKEFEHEEFWRTVVHFFINQPRLDLADVGLIVGYVHEQRHVPQEVMISQGDWVQLEPPQPNLTMKGRTPRSVLRQAAEWTTRGKRPPKLGSVRWSRSNIGEFSCIERDDRRSPRSWAIRELLTAAELVSEGQSMQHCVATYVRVCARRETSIWSLQLEFQGRWHRVMTIEVNLATRTICEARRRANVRPTPRARGIMERWAAQEGLAIEC